MFNTLNNIKDNMDSNHELNQNNSNQSLAHKMHHRKDVNDIVTRQHTLEEIISNLKSENIPVTPKILLEKMKKKGYKIDRSTLYRDRLAVNQRNSFLRDLSESNYSDYVENMWNDIEFVKQEAHEMMKNTTNARTRIIAGKLMLETVRTKVELFSGSVLNVSVELLAKKMQKFREENNYLKQRLENTHDSH